MKIVGKSSLLQFYENFGFDSVSYGSVLSEKVKHFLDMRMTNFKNEKLKRLEKSQNNAGNTQFFILLGLNYNSLRVLPKGFIRTVDLDLSAPYVGFGTCKLGPHAN